MSKTAKPIALVVEDEGLVRLLVAQVLSEAGFDVFEAGESASALDKLRAEGSIGLMVTDVGLPGLNGRRLADEARALRPDLPVLLMTGYAETGLIEKVLPAGFAFIRKPFDLDDLAAKATGLLEG